MKALCLVAIAVIAAACGDSSGPGARAASVTGVAGDSQSAPIGAQLAFPLSLTALNSSGQPVQDVEVTWSVTPTGAATFTPPKSVTDVNGVATTTVTMGSAAGAITIQAAVPGVSPVIYHATVIDPCTFIASYTLGQTVNGNLSTTDCNRGGFNFYYDYYALTLAPGQQSIRVSMASATFDTYLDFWSGNDPFPFVAFDDDVVLEQQPNSQLDIILPGDDYIIGANSYRQLTTGAYTLTVTNRAAAMNGCRAVWVMRGVSVADSITASDCADSSATPKHYDVARITVFASTVLTISEHSTAFNPYLAIYSINPNNYARTLVASNDDSSATNSTAYIAYNAAASSIYDIIIGTSAGGESGAYTFDVSASLTASPRASPHASSREFWRGSGLLPKRAKVARL